MTSAKAKKNTRKFGERLLQCEHGAGRTAYLISVLIRQGKFPLIRELNVDTLAGVEARLVES